MARHHGTGAPQKIARCALAGLAAASLGACGGPPRRYYDASAVVAGSLRHGAAPMVQVLSDGAAEVLDGGRGTIAFFPPDQCQRMKASDAAAGAQEEVILGSCGILVSSLERAAAVEGFPVVGWETLRQDSSGGGRSVVEAARQEGVAALFVIDELTVNRRKPGQTRVTGITFHEDDGTGKRDPLTLGDVDSVGSRCEEVLERHILGEPRAESVTLAAKMIRVADGRTQWIYRKTIGDPGVKDRRVDLRYEARPLEGGGGGLVVLGFALGAPGALAGGAGAYLYLEGESLPRRNTGAALILGGAALAAAGVVILAIGGAHSVEYEAPEAVLCRGPGLGTDDAAGAPDAPRGGSTWRSAKSTPGDVDSDRARTNELVQIAADDLIIELRTLYAAARHAAPSKAAPVSPAERCARSPVCGVQGRCSAAGEACVATNADDCRRSALCKRQGLCELAGSECVAKVDGDCAASEECRSAGRCTADAGRCVVGGTAR